jgi:predicted PurR-regulated permease PerM
MAKKAPLLQSNQMPEWIPRLIAMVVITVAALIFTVFLFSKLRGLISLVLIALFLSFALEPFVNRLVRRGWKRGLATGVILFGFLIGLVLLIGAMVPLIFDQVNEVVRQAPSWLTTFTEHIERWFNVSISQTDILNELKKTDGLFANYATNFAGNIFVLSKQVLTTVFQIFGVLLFTFYFVADAPRLRRVICSFLPPKSQRFVLSTWELAIDKTGGYMTSRALLGLLSSLASFVVLTLLGVPFAIPLALWMGIVSQFMPVIGTYLAASLPLVVALIAQPRAFVPLLIFILIYQQIENYIFAPRITARTMELHPAVAFAAVIAGASIAGVAGALLALPLAAILQESTREYLNRHELIESTLLVGANSTKKRTRATKKQTKKQSK